jgi:anti-sigma regulatory factor (Ser/Thr protein kinase)
MVQSAEEEALALLSASYAAVPGSVRLIRQRLRAIAAALGASEQQQENVCLAASEAASNAVEHAYGERRGEIHVAAALAGETMEVEIADDGCGLGGSLRSQGLKCGLAVMVACSERFSLQQRGAGGVLVQLRFAIG